MPKVIPGYKDDAKRTIIQAAIDVIAERGFALTTIEEIANRLGVSKGAVYWYFPNKDALINEVCTYILDDFKRIPFTTYYNHSIDQFLRLVFNQFSSNDHKKRKVFFEMIALSQRNCLGKNNLSAFLFDFTHTLEEIVKAEQKKGTLNEDIDPETYAFLIASQFLGIHLLSMLWFPQEKMDKVWEGFSSHMFQRKAVNPDESTDKKKKRKNSD